MKSKRTFVIKLAVIGVLIVFLLPELILATGLLQKHVLIGKEVYEVIGKSKSATECKTIILGDSVARSLYPPSVLNRKYDSLASSASISMVGQYLLTKNILEKNSGITEVVLIYHPVSFENDLDWIWSFNYFLKPFYGGEYMRYISKTAEKRIRKISCWLFSVLPIVKFSNISPEVENYAGFERNGTIGKTYMPSDLSAEYLVKIKKMLDEKKIRFRVISPRLDEKYKKTDSSKFRDVIKKSGLEYAFSGYFDFSYMASEYFSDHVHYKDAKILGDDPFELGK